MNYKRILQWVARILLLFLGFCGIATIISDATNPDINLGKQVLEIAWVFGIGGFLLFFLSFVKIFNKGMPKGRRG